MENLAIARLTLPSPGLAKPLHKRLLRIHTLASDGEKQH